MSRKPHVLLFFCLILSPVLAASQIDTLLNTGSVWKYATAAFPGTNWDSLGFNDAAWASGPSQLGWGEGDEATVVPSGPSGNRYTAYYFRKSFNLPASPSFRYFLIRVKRDDGIVLYANGNEIWRDNMPAGTPAYATLASAAAADDGQSWIKIRIPASTFPPGNNLLAAEVHQSSITSSDVSFDLQLIGIETGAVVLQRGPYLQMATDTSMNIRWRTDTVSSTLLRYGTSPLSLTQVISDTARLSDHEVHIPALLPNTRYYYSVGQIGQTLQGDSLNYFYTAGPRGQAQTTRIWVTGDCGTAYSTQTSVMNELLSYVGNQYINAWLLLGDNAYNAGLDSEYTNNFFEPYQAGRIMRQTCIWPAPGNHDYANNGALLANRSLPYYQNFTMPVNGELGGYPSGTEAFYSYNISNIHFISLDAYGTENSLKLYDTTGVQATWLKNDLDSNRMPWTILYWHHPPFTKGSHNSDTETELINIRTKLLPILDRYKVDLILCGHSHCYERSRLMRGYYTYDSLFNASVHLSDSSSAKYDGSVNSCPYVKDTNAAQNEGIVYVVAGSAGKFGGTSNGYPHNAMYYSNATNGGSLYLEINNNRLDAKFISDAGVIQDRFSLFKNTGRRDSLTINEGLQLQLSAQWPGTYMWPGIGVSSASVNISPIYSRWFTVTDSLNCLTDSFFVRVIDTIVPAVSPCPANIQTVNATGQCGRNVSWIPPIATDNHLSTFTVSQAPGTFFPVGSTQIIYTATDSSGNSSSCSFQVSVQDTEAPVLNCPASLLTQNDPGSCGAIRTFSVTVSTDNCGSFNLTQISGLASGSLFPIGTTTQVFQAEDAYGNLSNCGFSITVSDTSAPLITCPQSVSVATAPGLCTRTTSFAAPLFTDNCSNAQLSQLSGLSSGASFPSGLNTISYRVTDASGLSASCTFSIEVIDSEAPLAICPPNLNVHTDSGQCGAIVSFNAPAASDNCGIASDSLLSGQLPGTYFPRGTTNMLYSATDFSGNASTCTFSVTVIDAEPPLLTCPADTQLIADPAMCAAVIVFNPASPIDNCSIQSFAQTAGPLSGDTLSPGIHIVQFEAQDSALNTSTCQFRIEILDTTAPVFSSCPQQAMEACDSAVVSFSTPLASDLCGSLSLNQTQGLPSGSIFPLGTNTIRFDATDGNRNSVACVFDVVIVPLPQAVILNLPDTMCSNDPAYIVFADPPGGTFSGPGMNAAQLNPAAAGIGTHFIQYAYTDSNGCSDTARQAVYIGNCATGTAAESISEISLYPNPSKGQVWIQGIPEQAEMYFFNATGESLPFNLKREGELWQMDVSAYSKGIYFIRIGSGEGAYSLKLILLE